MADSNPEDISTFFQTLHNSSSSSSSCMNFKNQFIPSFPTSKNVSEGVSDSVMVPPQEDGHGFGGSRDAVNFSDPGFYYKENVDNTFYPAFESDSNVSCKRKVLSSENDLDEFSCDSEKGPEVSEVPLNPARPRGSSKRSRAAEVHNLSEKRRRSRINEKMKALQSLIPNSNKTDKASMLDEAIEYLKQLQLQVQMLTMRNGLGFHPMCLPGSLQLPNITIGLDETAELVNSEIGTATVHDSQQASLQAVYGLPNHCAPLSQSPSITSLENVRNGETNYGFELPMQAPFDQLNPPTSSKEICRDDALSQVQLDTNQGGNNPPPGVS